MPDYPIAYNEESRLAAVHDCGLLDTGGDPRFDRMTRLASFATDCPMAFISLIATKRQWFKSRLGFPTPETPRDWAFCNYTILESDVFVVEDAAADLRFIKNPVVASKPHVRFYAGVALPDRDGHRLGSLCVIDTAPRRFTLEQRRTLRDLAQITSELIIDLQRSGAPRR
jgi:GAF domain-containing protein